MDITPLTKSVIVIIGLSCLGLLSACQKTAAPSTAQYQTVSTRSFITAPSYQQTQQFSGVVRSSNTTAIGFELSGKINQLNVDIGDKVKMGQLLAKLDTQLLHTEKNELKANLTQNQAELDLANSTLKRSLSLKQKNYISEQKIDELKGQVNRLMAARTQLKAAYAANQLKIEKSNIIAPFNGIISQRHHYIGEVTSTGTPIYTLVQSNSPQAYIGVPSDIAKSLTINKQANIRIANHNYLAKIKGISAELNPITRTVELRFTLPQDSQVINGEIAYFTHIKDVEMLGYWVPISALTDGIRGLWNIYVLTPRADKSFNVERRDIDILYSNQDQAYIQGPISDSQLYIDQGSHKLVAGQKVNIIKKLVKNND
ncbi:efflux RND transporter periplasmic adaptor subunit [Shewanella surugensis]|uniref:Efflux RND transporter periplasmic adaptor subunit n=1 Tax=Shewanella surugensis TaxID=212020 RepID=A0ABT0LBH5_9GAMM|nr:efflux RND transporter periplasmic adaptor subunit [Shewanella surugensis]MCL1125058.1 efflux RND transporter periplasmic adaptor subunit [Shewanella surugensis]